MKYLLIKLENSDTTSLSTDSSYSADIRIRPAREPLSPSYGTNRRNFFKRNFKKMEKGSLRGSVFSLCASAIGSGVLALPSVLAQIGWLMGIILIINGAIAAIWSLRLIAKSAIKKQVKNYSKLCEVTGGSLLSKLL